MITGRIGFRTFPAQHYAQSSAHTSTNLTSQPAQTTAHGYLIWDLRHTGTKKSTDNLGLD